MPDAKCWQSPSPACAAERSLPVPSAAWPPAEASCAAGAQRACALTSQVSAASPAPLPDQAHTSPSSHGALHSIEQMRSPGPACLLLSQYAPDTLQRHQQERLQRFSHCRAHKPTAPFKCAAVQSRKTEAPSTQHPASAAAQAPCTLQQLANPSQCRVHMQLRQQHTKGPDSGDHTACTMAQAAAISALIKAAHIFKSS